VWCGGGGGVVVVFLPIIIPHQQSCFVLFCFVGWIVAIMSLIFKDLEIIVKTQTQFNFSTD
jgi:ABC-type polysaccharide/polyol phosphate export permease